jgi:hypothetical protein
MKLVCILLAFTVLAVSVFSDDGITKSVFSVEITTSLYQAVANQVRITFQGVKDSSINATVDNGTCARSGDFFIITPLRTGKCELAVFEGKPGRKTELGRRTLNVIALPTPLAAINGTKRGGIAKNVLMAAGTVTATLENPAIQAEFTVTQFSISAVIQGFAIEESSNSNQYTQGQRNLINNCSRGSYVLFTDIKARGPDGVVRDIPSLVLKIN